MVNSFSSGDGYWLATCLLATLLSLYLWLLLKLVQQLRRPSSVDIPIHADASASSHPMIPAGLALLVGLLCLVPLADYWHTGYSGYQSIGGLLPYSDAADWLHGTLHLASQGELNDWAARRPLNAVFLSGLLYLSDSQVPLMLILRALLLAAAFTCCCAELQRQMPRLPALFTSLLVVVLAYPYLPSLLSESHGLLFGVLGFTLLLRGVTNRHLTSYVVGAGLLSCALMLRMGGFGVLLALLLWPLAMPRADGSFRWFVSTAIGISAGLGLSLLWGALIYSGNNSSGSNFSYTLYGLAQGGASWQLFFEHFPEAASKPEPEQALLAYKAAWAQMQANPLALIQGWWQFFANYWRYLFVWVPGSLGKFLLPVFALGLAQLAWGWRDLNNRFLVFCFVGVLLTTPWIYWSASASRAFIATTLLELIIVGRGLHMLVLGTRGLWYQAIELTLQNAKQAHTSAYGTWFTLAMCVACLTLIPYWANQTSTQIAAAEQMQSITCADPAVRLTVSPKQALYLDLQGANQKVATENNRLNKSWNDNHWNYNRLEPRALAQHQVNKNPIVQAVVNQSDPIVQLWWVFDATSPRSYRYLMLDVPIYPTRTNPVVLCAIPAQSGKSAPLGPITPPLLWQAVAS